MELTQEKVESLAAHYRRVLKHEGILPNDPIRPLAASIVAVCEDWLKPELRDAHG